MNVPFIGYLMCCGGAAVCTARGDFIGTGMLLIAALACAGIERYRAAKAKEWLDEN